MTPSLLAVGSGFGLGLALIVAIGAQNAFVLRQGLRGEHVVAVVAVCALSDLLLITAGVAGTGALLDRVPGGGHGRPLGGRRVPRRRTALLAARRALRPVGALRAEAADRTPLPHGAAHGRGADLAQPARLPRHRRAARVGRRRAGRPALGASAPARRRRASCGSRRWARAPACCDRCSPGRRPGGCSTRSSPSSWSCWPSGLAARRLTQGRRVAPATARGGAALLRRSWTAARPPRREAAPEASAGSLGGEVDGRASGRRALPARWPGRGRCRAPPRPGEAQHPPAQRGQRVVALLVPRAGRGATGRRRPRRRAAPPAKQKSTRSTGLVRRHDLRREAVEACEHHAHALHRLEHRPALGVAALDDPPCPRRMPPARQPGDRVPQLVDARRHPRAGRCRRRPCVEARQRERAVEDGLHGGRHRQRREPAQRHEVLRADVRACRARTPSGEQSCPWGTTTSTARRGSCSRPQPRSTAAVRSAATAPGPSSSSAHGTTGHDGRVDALVGHEETGERRAAAPGRTPGGARARPGPGDRPGQTGVADPGRAQLLPARARPAGPQPTAAPRRRPRRQRPVRGSGRGRARTAAVEARSGCGARLDHRPPGAPVGGPVERGSAPLRRSWTGTRPGVGTA